MPIGVLRSLGELDAVGRRLSLDGPESEAAAIQSVRRQIDDFIRFRRELVRLARDSSPAAARAFGDNSADRANREALNQELDGLTARYAHYAEINDARAELSRSRVVYFAEISAAMPILAMMLGVFVILRRLAGAEREILKHTRRFEIALNNMQQGLCMFDREDRLIVCNERFAKMYAVPGELTQPGAAWRDIVAHRLKTIGYRDLTFDDVMAEHNGADLEKIESAITRSLRDGRTILIRRQPIKEGGWVATHEDITERRKAEEQLSLVAHHDALTGLANRVLFQRAVGGGGRRPSGIPTICGLVSRPRPFQRDKRCSRSWRRRRPASGGGRSAQNVRRAERYRRQDRRGRVRDRPDRDRRLGRSRRSRAASIGRPGEAL